MLSTPKHAVFTAGRRAKKNPQPSHGRLGILPERILHSLILEDLCVKDIQAGFLTLGSFYFLRLPTLRQAQGSGRSQVSSPTTAAGPSPISPSEGSRGSLYLNVTVYIINKILNRLSRFLCSGQRNSLPRRLCRY